MAYVHAYQNFRGIASHFGPAIRRLLPSGETRKWGTKIRHDGEKEAGGG